MALGKLRRQDRAMAVDESEGLLERALVGRVGTIDGGGAPHVTPMNFVYDARLKTVFLHCATTGQLLDNLSAEPRVCFEVDEPGAIIAVGDLACETSQVYLSVICFGKGKVIAEDSEKRRALELFAQKYIARLMPDRKWDPEMATFDATTAIAIEVETMTGKARRAP